MTGAADACVTSSASAGIALATASLICQDQLAKVRHLYEILPQVSRREVIMLKGHNVDFGAPVALMVATGGGRVVETGYANGCDISDIRAMVTERTLAILYVKSHHCVQKKMPDAGQIITLAKELGVPCIIDAAAEEDLHIYNQLGADFVCYSGAKAVEGPTSGFVLCQTAALADNMRLQYKGIGRTMKVGKEAVMGLLAALEDYVHNQKILPVQTADMEKFRDNINNIAGCSASIVPDEAGRNIFRVSVSFNPEVYGHNAIETAALLEAGTPAIYTRDYYAESGVLTFDPRPLKNVSELTIIYDRLKEIAGGK